VSGLCHYEELEGDDGQEVQDEIYHSDDDDNDDCDDDSDEQRNKR
jgi:hypothetical protein